jgi:hypothetical protein
MAANFSQAMKWAAGLSRRTAAQPHRLILLKKSSSALP